MGYGEQTVPRSDHQEKRRSENLRGSQARRAQNRGEEEIEPKGKDKKKEPQPKK